MLSQAYLEYRCPRCGYINAIARETVLDMYKEQSDACQHCKQKLENTTRIIGASTQVSWPGGSRKVPLSDATRLICLHFSTVLITGNVGI